MDLFFCVLYVHVLLGRYTPLIKGLVLLCLVWSCFTSAGRYAPLIKFQWTHSFVSYMVIFCYSLYSPHQTSKDLLFCVLYGHVLLVQDVILPSLISKGLVLLCPRWSSFANAGRYARLMELERTCSTMSYMLVFC
jgi:hypothetical protein